MNICASMVDTVTAKIAKMKPMTTFLTEGGTFSQQQQAKNLQKWVSGQFYANDMYSKHQLMFRDGCIFDAGFLKHYYDPFKKKICTERVPGSDIWTDEADSLDGDPTILYQVKMIHKHELIKMYPKYEGAIRSSKHTLETSISHDDQLSDFLLVVEAWKKTVNGRKGRRVVCIENETFVDKPYDKEYFPFTDFMWSRPTTGYFGQSLVERLTGNQIEINKMLRIIQRSFHLGSTFKVFLEYGSRVQKNHLNNEIGSIVYYAGKEPIFHVPKTVHNEFFQHLDWLITRSYEEAGITQLSAAGRKPSGLDAAVALREYQQVESERFVLVGQQYENTFKTTAEIYIDIARDLYKKGIDLETTVEAKRFVKKIKWSEIDIDKDAYHTKIFATNMLPHTPAGRLQYIKELMSEEFIDRTTGMKLLDFPDLESYTNLEMAMIESLEMTLEEIIDNNNYIPPTPEQNLEYGIRLFQAAVLRATLDKVPGERIDKLRRWKAQAQKLLDMSRPAPITPEQPVQIPGQMPQAVSPNQPKAQNMSAAVPAGAGAATLNPKTLV